MKFASLLLLSSFTLAAVPSARDISRVIAARPSTARAHWGIVIVDLHTGRPVYRLNAGKLFQPASNAKVLSTALALDRLGPDYTFETAVRMEGRDLVLVGGGDPTLSGRVMPYDAKAKPGDPLVPLDQLADAVAAAGVRVIDGDIIGDDTAYVWEPYPPGWTSDDATWEYGAPVSALVVNDNSFRLIVRPGAGLMLSPAVEYFHINNRVTAAPGPAKIDIARDGREISITGSVPLNPAGVPQLLAVDDPALYAAWVFRDLLTRRGVTVRGRPVARHRFPGELPRASAGQLITRRQSAPLVEVLEVIDKVSQNLQAEIVLREIARVRRGDGTRELGLEELSAFLAEAGSKPEEHHIVDGSGLSRLNRVAPQTIMNVLLRMYRSPHRQSWIRLMPVGGEDGTLASRFGGTPAAGRVHAKTGTIHYVSGLSGYAHAFNNRWYAFSILANGGPTADVRAASDAVVNLLVGRPPRRTRR
jgi:D-alanyl-D-alanine carboxypeptidase/D-alanyl-D-alanine-endopeptidase (penicillin-binding protein 4)